MSDDRDVLATFDALYAAACEARDARAIVDLFVTDGDVTFWGSEEAEQAFGPAGLREIAEAVASSPTQFSFQWRKKRVRVEGDVAWVNAVGTVAVGEPPRTLPYRVTGVLLRRDGRWLWHTHSGSEPNPG